MENNYKAIEKFINDIKQLSYILNERGNGSAQFFSDAASTLIEIPKGEKWFICLENICRCAAITSYGDFNENETYLLFDIIEQGLLISKKLGIENY